MTLTRKIAMNISNSVVRYASPGCKEWAEGLAREVTFIENDWTALAWALGSTRVLLHPREAPIRSLDDVPAVALRFEEATRMHALGMWVYLLQGPLSLWEFFRARSWLGRAGCAFVVLCSISAGIFLLIEQRRLKSPSDDIYDDIVACTLHYKAELQRRFSTQLIYFSVLLIELMGMTLPERHYVNSFNLNLILYALLALGMAFVLIVVRRSYRRQIKRLDTLLEERL